MQTTERSIHSTIIIALTGRLVFDSRKAFQRALKNAHTQNPRHLVINLQDVAFIDSAGMGLLGLAFEDCKTQNRQISLIRPQGRMNDLLELSKFPTLVPTFSSEQEAWQAVPLQAKS